MSLSKLLQLVQLAAAQAGPAFIGFIALIESIEFNSLIVDPNVSFVFQKVKTMEIGDAVIIDADANTVTSEYDDLQTLPEDIVR